MGGLVPTIDMQASDAPGRLDEACAAIGFFQVVGHGVPAGAIEDMERATAAFFALPMAEKLACRPAHAGVNRGYAAPGSEALAYSLGVDTAAPPDLFEAFNVGAEMDGPPPAGLESVFPPNIWPPRPAGLRPALLAYFDEVVALAHRLTDLFALALGLTPDFFAAATDHSTDTLRVNHYERRAGEPEPVAGQMRMGPHTDYGILTVLHADQVPGLQIVAPDGRWQDVQPDPGAFLVNLGDLTAEWTNDRWRSTLHRVVPPPDVAGGPARRRSVALFHDGNDDAVIECLPTCCSADRPPRYPPVRAGDHLRAKLLGPRTLSPSQATSTLGGRAGAVIDRD